MGKMKLIAVMAYDKRIAQENIDSIQRKINLAKKNGLNYITHHDVYTIEQANAIIKLLNGTLHREQSDDIGQENQTIND